MFNLALSLGGEAQNILITYTTSKHPHHIHDIQISSSHTRHPNILITYTTSKQVSIIIQQNRIQCNLDRKKCDKKVPKTKKSNSTKTVECIYWNILSVQTFTWGKPIAPSPPDLENI